MSHSGAQMPPAKRPTRSLQAEVPATAPPSERARSDTKRSEPPAAPLPFLLDFLPLEDAKNTRLSAFFEALRAGRLTTTRCLRDQALLWPPRVACPKCHSEELEWVDLPSTGHIYAFSAVLAGAPLGMEAEVPFVVGLVDLDGVALRLFGRILGVEWTTCRIGLPVRFEPYEAPDGRVFYRFRAG